MGFFNVQKGDAPLFHPVALNLHHLHGPSISLRLCGSARPRRFRFSKAYLTSSSFMIFAIGFVTSSVCSGVITRRGTPFSSRSESSS